MKRREFFRATSVAGAVLPLLPGRALADSQHEGRSGPLAAATMTFGSWRTDTATDRHANPQSGTAINWHSVVPHTVTIAAGGTVNFVIAGLHQIAIYTNGVQPSDINVALSAADAPQLIDDPAGRIYRGLNPFPLRAPIAIGAGIQHVVARDRNEAVHFPEPGTYLVICTVRSHFVDHAMWGSVRVLP
jgi:plastocyanin